jgi:hypothetical protein
MKVKLSLLFILSIFLSLPRQAKAVMNEVYNSSSGNIQERKLQSGEVISESFTSPVEEFSIITIKLDSNKESDDDKVIFRIKEKGQEDWYYETKVSTKDFRPEWPYPFGFPTIENAKEKEFVWELEYLGHQENSQLIYFKSKDTIIFNISNNQPIYKVIPNAIFFNIIKDPLFMGIWGLIILLLLLKYFITEK